MHKTWKLKNTDLELQSHLCDELGVHEIVAQLLINRGVVDIDEAKAFLYPEIDALHDPFLMKDMTKAIDRIRLAAKEKQRVMIYGDYDVDGVTSSVVLNRVFRKLGIDVVHRIPHRMEDGYGLNMNVAEDAVKENVSLVVTIDCGITAICEVNAINEKGIDVIVCDHHEASEEGVPDAYAILNPKQPGCPYPFKQLASAGLAAKITQAIEGKLPLEILDLVAIGTIADIVPLRGENRIFVKNGLPRLAYTKNKGLIALMDVAKMNLSKPIKPFHVGFVLGPRINAAGRMDSAHGSLDLFLCEDSKEAYEFAKSLDKHNLSRQKMQREVIQEALDLVEQEEGFKDSKVIVLSKEGWHKGVLGIVASRITEKYYRPAIVVSLKDGVGTASARSIDGFHLHETLEKCSQWLEEFGGHQGAAGLTIKEENIDPFREFINECADDILKAKNLNPILNVDSEIELGQIDLKLAEIIDTMEPFGEGNPQPVFCSRNVMAKSYPALLGKDTIKFWVTDGESTISVVGFGMSKFKGYIFPGANIDIAYQIMIDDWNKAPTPQLKLEDVIPAVMTNEEFRIKNNKVMTIKND